MDAFSHFSDKHLSLLDSCATTRSLPEGAELFREGESSFAIHGVFRGRLRVQRSTTFGPLVLGRLEAGTLVGDCEFIDRKGRVGDAVAESAVELITIDPERLEQLSQSDRTFDLALAWALWKSLSARLRLANARLAAFFGQSAEPRSAAQISPEDSAGEGFRVDMGTKRSLFQEQKLTSMEINFLASLSREEKFGPGEVIFREGDAGDKMYVVLDGQVMISTYIPGAGEEALAFLDRGTYFGEMALIDSQPRSAEAKAHSGGAIVLAIPREVVAGILDINKVSSVRLLKLLCSLVAQRLRESDEKLLGWHLLAGGKPSSEN
jgi:CRP-like cAMP-binding protein